MSQTDPSLATLVHKILLDADDAHFYLNPAALVLTGKGAQRGLKQVARYAIPLEAFVEFARECAGALAEYEAQRGPIISRVTGATKLPEPPAPKKN